MTTSLASIDALSTWLSANLGLLHRAESAAHLSGILAREVAPRIGCGGILGVLGKLLHGRLHVLTGVCVGIDPALLRSAADEPMLLADRRLVQRWLDQGRAVFFDPTVAAHQASAIELEEIRRYGLGRMAMHGAVETSGASGSYFSFCRLAEDAQERVLPCLELLAPHLHIALQGLWRRECAAITATLSPCERQLLGAVAAGKTNAQIALDRGRSAATVRNQLHALMQKLSVSSRTQLIARALDMGLLAA